MQGIHHPAQCCIWHVIDLQNTVTCGHKVDPKVSCFDLCDPEGYLLNVCVCVFQFFPIESICKSVAKCATKNATWRFVCSSHFEIGDRMYFFLSIGVRSVGGAILADIPVIA